MESREAWSYQSHPHGHVHSYTQDENALTPVVQHAAMAYLLGLLDTGHVLSGQAGAVQGLLWILSVALQHLGLQLGAHRRRLSRSAQ